MVGYNFVKKEKTHSFMFRVTFFCFSCLSYSSRFFFFPTKSVSVRL
jgi:hypothetical protein